MARKETRVWVKLVGLAVGGAAGTIARYGVSGLAQRLSGEGFPAGTLAVNAAGCFLLGLLWTLAEGRLGWTPAVRAAVFVGFLGAFTTFSTYAFETTGLLRDGQWVGAATNLVLQNGLGILFVIVGVATARLL